VQTAPDSPLIITTAGLEAIIPALAEHPRIALDTEADSLHCYFEKLCLIQISIPGANFLVDPLAGLSLQPLLDLLREREMVLHGADYDLRLMRRFGFERPQRLFDTMIAARLCGRTEFSLAALISHHFGLQLTKASQKADWARRPLSPQMVEYAINDTRYLLELAESFEAKLKELGRWEWFEQSCEKAIASAAITKERDPETIWRIAGHADLSDRGSAILRALWHWRDQEAQHADRPAFHVLHNEQLVRNASRLDRGEPAEIPHLRGSRKQRFDTAAAAAVELPPDQWPKVIRKPRPKSNPDFEKRFKMLRDTRDTAAKDLQLDPSLIAPKATLERIAADPEQARLILMPWQLGLLKL
jgi:ribonuclease D